MLKEKKKIRKSKWPIPSLRGCRLYQHFVYFGELTLELGIEELAVVESVIVWAVGFCMITRSESSHFVTVLSVVGEKMFNFVSEAFNGHSASI